jgi:hypothetical protein
MQVSNWFINAVRAGGACIPPVRACTTADAAPAPAQRVRVWRPAIFAMCKELEDASPDAVAAAAAAAAAMRAPAAGRGR